MRLSTSSIVSMSLFGVLASVSIVSADPPKKPKAAQYSRLWMNSPFTIKPEKKAVVVASPLERDWMLGSIRPSGEGYAVTLINKKDRKDRIRFLPGVASGDYQLMQVQQDTQNHEKSRVQIRKGSQLGWISYDVALVKVRTTNAAAKKTSKTTTSKGSAKPPIPGRSSSSTSSKSRVRSVPRTGR